MKTIVLVVAFTSVAAAQSRDGATLQPQAGTATLVGIVTVDEPNGGPVRRALVSLAFSMDGANQRQTTTDEKGGFRFSNLPAGNARLAVSKPGFITTHYGARQPGATFGVPVALPEGRTTGVTMKMPRGGVITGTVFGDDGRPMSGAPVRVLRQVVSASGERSYETYSNSALIATTDDRGVYRIFGLPPGNFVVSAQPRALGTGEIRQPTAAELQWAERAVAGHAGANAQPDIAAAPAPGRTVAYVEVYHPGTVNAANAGVVTLAQGQERGGIDLRMQLVTTARVSGTVTMPDGQPARGFLITLLPEVEMLSQDTMRTQVLIEIGVMQGMRGAVQIKPDGTFDVVGVEPGTYTVIARAGPIGRAGGAGTATEPLWAMTDVTVDGRDVTGLALRLAAGQKISGRIVFESQRQAKPVRATVGLRPMTAKGLTASTSAAANAAAGLDAVGAAATTDGFLVSGIVPAPYRISANASGWTLKSLTIAGKDGTDATLEIRAGEDISDAVITFTDSAAEVAGMLYDAAGRPTSDLSIVLFSTDRAKWFAGSRWVRPAVRPASDGRYTLSGLAPGEYFLAALTEVSPADLNSVFFLEQVAPAAVKITVAAGERKTQDIKVAGK